MKIEFRPYQPDRDKKQVQRIWLETEWLEKGKEDILDLFLKGCKAWVGILDGEAEFLVAISPGTINYLDRDIPFSGVMAVTTSRIARKQGLARKFTARALAESVLEGAVVSGLGIFEQGFYDQLGYGSGGYEHMVHFDPADLKVPRKFNVPQRLGPDDYKEIHNSRLNRKKLHGRLFFDHPNITLADLKWTKKGFGLGYRDPGTGEITHHFWCSNRGGEHGPYLINWMAYRTYDQFLELMALIRSFNDQVRSIGMIEPAEIQLQDYLAHPFSLRMISKQGKYEAGIRASSWWQVRICDLEKALAQTELLCPELRFNLVLKDPVESFLDDNDRWQGLGGNYIVRLGKKCNSVKGNESGLDTLTCSVNAFTRLWLGIRPATGLAASDDLAAPESLLLKLNEAFCLPDPKPDWDY